MRTDTLPLEQMVMVTGYRSPGMRCRSDIPYRSSYDRPSDKRVGWPLCRYGPSSTPDGLRKDRTTYLLKFSYAANEERRDSQRGGDSRHRRSTGSYHLCYQCVRPGHIARYCPESRCYKCQERGHIAYECLQRSKSHDIGMIELRKVILPELSENLTLRIWKGYEKWKKKHWLSEMELIWTYPQDFMADAGWDVFKMELRIEKVVTSLEMGERERRGRDLCKRAWCDSGW